MREGYMHHDATPAMSALPRKTLTTLTLKFPCSNYRFSKSYLFRFCEVRDSADTDGP
ncbi:MAG: hypothetical protein MJE68_33090 [Proteobacteria bacterium]|nr:hypothetical protein [Pseudomonadota bacterium]